LQRKLKEREELRVVGSNSKSLDLPAEYISEQSRLELKAQAKKWSAIDDKMEVSLRVSSSYDLSLWKHCVIYTLQKHRHLGNLKQSTNEEVITKLRAPQEARLPHIREIIERAVSIRTVSKYYMLSRTYKYYG
jgi:predicted house-cleaning noncanonical NTP pyrophosphatase (MazG superfamily)